VAKAKKVEKKNIKASRKGRFRKTQKKVVQGMVNLSEG